MTEPTRHPATPAAAFRMGTLLQQRQAIEAELGALTQAEAKRLALVGNGSLSFDTATAEWIATPKPEAPGAP